MPIPKNKQELLTAIRADYSKLKQDLQSIPTESTQKLELEGHAKGTQMSISNLVAYLIGWGELVLKWNRKIEAGETVDFPETNYKWTELGPLAQKFYRDYEKESYVSLLNQLDETVEKIIALIEKKDNEAVYGVSWYKHYSMGRMIQLNTTSPYKNARKRVRKWKKGQSNK